MQGEFDGGDGFWPVVATAAVRAGGLFLMVVLHLRWETVKCEKLASVSNDG
jgi:hypothetical protein